MPEPMSVEAATHTCARVLAERETETVGLDSRDSIPHPSTQFKEV